MAIAIGSSSAVTDLATELASQASSGGGAGRASVGDRSVAFAWADSRPWAGTLFNSVLVEGLQYRLTVVSPSGTPAAKTPKGGIKPNVVAIAADTGTLPKYSGLARCYTEDLLDSANLVVAIESVLFDQIVAAINVDVAAVLAGAALTATGGDWTEAVLNAIGQLPSASLLLVSPADLAAVVTPASGFMASNSDALMTLFGLGVIPLPGLTAGTAFVTTRNAVTMFDSAKSPLMLLDPYSESANNVVLVIGDAFMAAELTSPGNAVKVTTTP